MNADDLKAFRAQARLSQTEMADLIGMKLRAYQELEAGKSAITPRHWQALERVSLKLALIRREIGLALPTIRKDALDYAELVRGTVTLVENLARERDRVAAELAAITGGASLVGASNATLAQISHWRRQLEAFDAALAAATAGA